MMTEILVDKNIGDTFTWSFNENYLLFKYLPGIQIIACTTIEFLIRSKVELRMTIS